ncbi:HlyD family secretion protein [Algibacter miyuki]|uniref:HlyD family secretion protein n=1 Tax=Algibacter miyuki TaxID=1306933 RepID=A0ABV5GYI5_9FLAO|nr:biotin/lipoyl-binding protein [Algibacter miyuki]MDN3667250.1 HlyD family efflux transporter periplasmic adaptor subunit [Algibacter miyuki]
MLNISNNRVSEYVDLKKFKSGKDIFTKEYHKRFNKFLIAFSVIMVIILFLPWTQNITSDGIVTTLKLNQRPQTLQSSIPGRIEEWFVQEGDFVNKGDTILRISEIKSDYFDEKLAERTGNQLASKSSSVEAYKNKETSYRNQIVALQQERNLKLEQARNKFLQAELKVKTDSMDLEAVKIKNDIAKIQYERTIALQEEGLKAVKDVEEKRSKLQESEAKLISQQNKYLSTKNDVINANLYISTLKATYDDKIAKAESSLFTAQSSGYDTEAQVSKLETNLANYQKRSSLLFVTAPQNGYINKAIRSGIGESFKEGEKLVNIMPSTYDLAVEMFVRPIDLPLLHAGEKVQVQFDGWPALVFSGWPNVSYGTYAAKIVAMEKFISSNGKYRVLLAPDDKDIPWPEEIRVGSGAKTIALLNDVPIWFEMWRQINSFPPNYYKSGGENEDSKDKKKT